MPFPNSKHKNPFDRLIIAQSIVENIPLVASDAFFGQYKDLKLIW
jgi:PIN domain nuclease of toxin-antitoxin system